MRAVLIDEAKHELYIGTVADPVPGDDELLAQVQATALNRADILQKRGHYPPPAGASNIIGLEMSGIIEQVGKNVANWQVGDRILALLPGGGYAEKVVLPARMAMPMPANLSFEEAAAIPEAYLTAYLALFQLGELKADQTALIHAGASGVGIAAIQLARAIDAKAIITAGGAKKCQACLEIGAQLALDHKAGPFAEAVKNFTGGRGVDLILDPVGANYFEQNIDCLTIDGRLIIIATMSGGKVDKLNLTDILRKRLRIIGTTLRARSQEFKIELTEQFAKFALPLFETGKISPVINAVIDWQEVNRAHGIMESNENIGKIVLKITG